MHDEPRYRLRVEKVRPPSEVLVGATFLVTAEGATLGREPGSGVWLLDPRVSRQHARLTWDGEQLWLERVSRHAIYVNQVEVTERTALQPLDWIQVGAILLRLTLDQSDTAPALDPISIDEPLAHLVASGATPLVLDRGQEVATLYGHALSLQPGPFATLAALATSPSRWVSAQTLAEAIWSDPEAANEAYVTKYVSYLRAAIAAALSDDAEAAAELREQVRTCADAFTRLEELDALPLAQLLREFVKVRTKVGYRLHLAPGAIAWKG